MFYIQVDVPHGGWCSIWKSRDGHEAGDMLANLSMNMKDERDYRIVYVP